MEFIQNGYFKPKWLTSCSFSIKGCGHFFDHPGMIERSTQCRLGDIFLFLFQQNHCSPLNLCAFFSEYKKKKRNGSDDYTVSFIFHAILLFFFFRVPRRPAGQSSHPIPGGANSPTQENKEQDAEMQAVRQLHLRQRRGMRGSGCPFSVCEKFGKETPVVVVLFISAALSAAWVCTGSAWRCVRWSATSTRARCLAFPCLC